MKPWGWVVAGIMVGVFALDLLLTFGPHLVMMIAFGIGCIGHGSSCQ
jgi:hypothetical protein